MSLKSISIGNTISKTSQLKDLKPKQSLKTIQVNYAKFDKLVEVEQNHINLSSYQIENLSNSFCCRFYEMAAT